jgi:succinyl-diaminopimelate desuccinylase
MAIPNLDVVSLTQQLVRIPSLNPPGDEESCARWLAEFLDARGFSTTLQTFGKRRFNLVAERLGRRDRAILGFTGHLDTVPLGGAPWKNDPFAGDIRNGRLYGRGSSDMKSGIAAFVTACTGLHPEIDRSGGVRLLLTGGEETGCDGARALRDGLSASLQRLGALIVGEPTANYPCIGHKGALWLRGTAKGRTAHGSMPEAGCNAIHKVARAVHSLESFSFDVSHPLMGGTTLNVGTIRGGTNVNSIPDHAEFELDIRTVPGMDHSGLCAGIAAHLGADIELTPFVNVLPLASDVHHPWVRRIFAACAPHHANELHPKAVSYFTDGSVLVPASGTPPTIILGPGSPEMAHKTDEYCSMARLIESVKIYEAILHDWASTESW